MHALNATTGNQIWSSPCGDDPSSPAVANGVIYVGGGNDVFALNAETGIQIWNYTTGGEVESSPAVANDVVYIGSDDHNIYALNATTGTQSWNCTTGGEVSSSPAVANGVIYVGSDDDNVYALNALTGTLVWNHATRGWVCSSPAVAGNIVYVGSNDSNVYALNALTGAQLWNFSSGCWAESSPAVANGVVYIELNGLHALDSSSGACIWIYQGGVSSPAVAGGVVYIVAQSKINACVLAIGSLAAPITSAKPEVLEQGEFSTLSFPEVNSINSGPTPYKYQWFSQAPPNPVWAAAQPFTLISGATLSSYLFVTSNSTTTGTWSFMVQKTDSLGESVNSTIAAVKVYPALTPCYLSASPCTVVLGQSCNLSSSSATTGISPYAYQWFSEAPDSSSYLPISGATEASYTFATQTSTVAGNWSFMLQVTDSMDASVNSSAATVTVNTPSTTPIPTATTNPPPTQLPTTTVLAAGVVVLVAAVVAVFMLLRKRQKLTR